MIRRKLISAIGIVITVGSFGHSALADGDPQRGVKAFRKCVACHVVEEGSHKTGPSLADIWGRKAGTIYGFRRYSKALKQSGITWTERTLDDWLKSPKALVPGNRMTFRGIKVKQERDDLIAYLKSVAAGDAPRTAQRGGGMMGAPTLLDLETVGPDQQVRAIRYCGDTYRVTTVAGQALVFWEFNLRFKTDSSDKGPLKGKPALSRGGMMGDRTFVIFAGPEEISSFIKRTC
jgi:cytochrome c